MLTFPDIDPIIFSIGPVAVRWYGFMYMVGFGMAWWLGKVRVKQRPDAGWTVEHVGDMVFYGALGVILGGRVGYMLVYGQDTLAHDPLALFKVWQGGMSFHGGVVGVLLGWMWMARRTGRSLWAITDFAVPLAPIGIGCVRIANFINGELWGRVSDVPWAMVFPTGGPEPRHPSQLYESLLEGWLLFAVLWWFTSKPRPLGAASGLFLVWYGCSRFLIEFFRQPDAHLGFIAFDWMSMGQLLSLPLIMGGTVLLFWAYGANRDRLSA